MSSRSPLPHVVVIGAGITGLAAAHALVTARRDRPFEVTVLEGSGRAGGKILTVDLDGMPVEGGADSFVVRKPWAVDLCSELGLSQDVVIPGAWGAFVWTREQLVAYPDRSPFGIPSDVGDLLRWQGLPRGPKLRALLDLFRPPRRNPEDEPLGSLLRRRLGNEASRVLVEPLLGGLHSGDPARLSVLATFPELRDWETKHGSLVRGAKAAVAAAGEERGHKPLFATLWGGLSGLVDHLVEAVGRDRVSLGSPVGSIERDSGGLSIITDGAAGRVRADAVIVSTPAPVSAQMLRAVSAEASSELSAIPYASTAVVLLAYPPGTGSRLPQGTGFVVPSGEGTITACTWISRKWPREEFGDRVVLRCFVGRAGAEEPLGLADETLAAAADDEVQRATPLQAEPVAWRVLRWKGSMPQYEVGHLDRVGRIEEAVSKVPGLFVAGSAYRGIGIPDCIRQGREAAAAALAFMERTPLVSGNGKVEREALWTS